MSRAFITHGVCIMIGLACGVLLCFQPVPSAQDPSPAPVAKDREYHIEFNGNADNWTAISGIMGGDAVVTWWPEEQAYSIPPTIYRDGVGVGPPPTANRWVTVKVNGRNVNMWGFMGKDGRPAWRIEDQRTHVTPASASDQSASDQSTAPVISLPSGFRPPREAKTGALLMGVDARKLEAGPGGVTSSDPATQAAVEDVARFYAQAPDDTAKTVARSLPKVISPNDWAFLFGCDLPTAALRVSGALLLAASLSLAYRQFGA